MCVDSHCTFVNDDFLQYNCSCSNNGVCNNIGACHCSHGSSGESCQHKSGCGGSAQSGPQPCKP